MSTLAERIKALPSIKDEAGADCISREVVLVMLEDLLKSLKLEQRMTEGLTRSLAEEVRERRKA